MKTHAILELDEGALTVTLGGRAGGTATVTGSRRQPLSDWTRDSVVAALQPLLADLLEDVGAVHVVLGDRRMQHFVQVLPRLPARDVEEFAMREAMRLTSMPAAHEVLVAVRPVRRPKGKLVVGGAAMPRSVWEPVRLALSDCGLQVLGVHTTESCLALAAPDDGDERYAVVECAGGRARFVLCDGGSPVQVRRFMIGAAEANPEALAAQLALELPRTLEWLRETGHQVPSALVLGNRISVDEATLDTIRGDLARVVLPSFVAAAGRGFEAPSLASTALLRELCLRGAPPSLSATPRFRAPAPAWRWFAAAAALLVAAALVGHGVRDERARALAERQLAEVRRENDALRHRLGDADDVEDPVASPATEQLLAQALGLRRPVSRLVAEVCEATRSDVLLDGLQFASNERVLVSGVVRGSSRAAALALLAEFARRVNALPYLESTGHEDVGEVPGMANHFRFRLGLAWRTT